MEPTDKNIQDEGKRWEQDHVSSALFSFGAKDKTKDNVCLFLCSLIFAFKMN